MSLAPKTYEIRTLDDFTSVPEDRLDACLAEFAVAVQMQRAMRDLMNAVAAEIRGTDQPPSIGLKALVFRWTDDGLTDKHIVIRTAEGA